MDLANAIELLVRNGDGLRRAGVRDLQVGDVKVSLAAPEAVPDEHPEPDEDIGDPLMDPMTFGRRTSVPSFDRGGDR